MVYIGCSVLISPISSVLASVFNLLGTRRFAFDDTAFTDHADAQSQFGYRTDGQGSHIPACRLRIHVQRKERYPTKIIN